MEKFIEVLNAKGWEYSINEEGMVHFILGNEDFEFHISDTTKIDEILAEIKEWWS